MYGWRASNVREKLTGERPFPGYGRPRDEEITALKRENERLRQEREILKKALGLFTPTSK